MVHFFPMLSLFCVAGITAFLLREGSLSTTVASIISCLISAAVLLSYPLQLYPALQVIEAYCGFSREYSERPLSCCQSIKSNLSPPGSPQYTRHVPEVSSCPSSSALVVTILQEPSCHCFGQSNDSVIEENSPLVLEMGEHTSPQSKMQSPQNSGFLPPCHHSQSEEDSHPEAPPRFPRVSVRIMLVLISSLVATLIPNVGLLVSLAGASSGAALALIFPPLFDLTLRRDSKEPLTLSEQFLHFFSIGLGSLAAVLGTAVSVMEILRTLVSFGR
jgi:hypothetical protein